MGWQKSQTWLSKQQEQLPHMGLQGGTSGKESTCQCRRHRRCRLDSWVRMIPWSRKWQPIPVFLQGKFHEQRGLAIYRHGVPKSWICLSDWAHMCVHTHAHTHTHTHTQFPHIPSSDAPWGGCIGIYTAVKTSDIVQLIHFADLLLLVSKSGMNFLTDLFSKQQLDSLWTLVRAGFSAC